MNNMTKEIHLMMLNPKKHKPIRKYTELLDEVVEMVMPCEEYHRRIGRFFYFIKCVEDNKEWLHLRYLFFKDADLSKIQGFVKLIEVDYAMVIWVEGQEYAKDN